MDKPFRAGDDPVCGHWICLCLDVAVEYMKIINGGLCLEETVIYIRLNKVVDRSHFRPDYLGIRQSGKLSRLPKITLYYSRKQKMLSCSD